MLTGIVLTKNEQENLPRCLDSLKFCDAVLIIDDRSTDSTAEIAKNLKVRVVTHSLAGDFSAARNFALSQVDSGWCLFVDADEVVSQNLAQEIQTSLKKTDQLGYYIPRIDYFKNHPLHYGDTGHVSFLRLAQKSAGTWLGSVHETWQISGPVGDLHNPLLHYPHPTIADFVHHINNYSTIRASELYKSHVPASILTVIFYPPAKFIHLYFFKFGLLDGTPGFIYAMMMAFYSFLVRAKLYLLYV